MVREIERLCQGCGVPLRAAALRMSTRDARVGSTVVGTASPAHVDELVELISLEIPDDLWEELSALGTPEAPVSSE
jgi:D-threo-aldose 1-dehydrogenase